MNIARLFIQRKIATTLLAIGLGLAGLVAYFLLPVSPYPNIDIPTIAVSANMPGASPETMASSVATPLERHLGAIAGVTEMTSRSNVNNTQIVLQFDINRDIDGAALQSHLPQVQSCGFSHPDPGHDLQDPVAGTDLRPSLQYHSAETVAGCRGGRCLADRRFPAGHPHRTQSAGLVQIWHRAGGCRRRDQRRQCQQSQRRYPAKRPELPGLCQRHRIPGL